MVNCGSAGKLICDSNGEILGIASGSVVGAAGLSLCRIASEHCPPQMQLVDVFVVPAECLQEYAIAAGTFSLSKQQVIELSRRGIGYTFATEAEKQLLKKQIETFAAAHGAL